MNYFDSLYTLQEIAINHNIKRTGLSWITHYSNEKDIDSIKQKFPELAKFIPYCKWYKVQDKNILAMSAYVYDVYKDTGILPSLENYDINPDVDRLEHWQYVSPLMFEINPESGFEFAKEYFKDAEVWNVFLSGCARMNYYEGSNTTLEQRIKYAIVEYMLRRRQFFTTNDFVDNPILHKKYKKDKEGNSDGK